MKFSKTFYLIITFFLALAAANAVSIENGNAVDFYNIYQADFEFEGSDSIFVKGYECLDSNCENVQINPDMNVYDGQIAITCINNVFNNGNVNQFETCMSSALVNNNIVDTSDNDFIVTRTDLPVNFGTIEYFSTQGDNYIPQISRSTSYQCSYSICIDQTYNQLNFEKKRDAIAEIQNFNVKNTEDSNKPIQVEIPVELDSTVCSAYQYTYPNAYRPTIPSSYSDFKAETKVDLRISKLDTDEQLATKTVNLNIEADTCTGTATFSWTPSQDVHGESIKFRVESLVTDEQVFNSIKDFAEVVEVVYPQDLTNSCYSVNEDFSLTNEPNSVSPSLSEILVGESLYANFRSGSFISPDQNTQQPIEFRTEIFIGNNKVYDEILLSDNNLDLYSINLSDYTQTPGTYPVRLVTTPQNSNCDITNSDELTLNMVIKPLPRHDVEFYVRDENSNPLNDVTIDFELIESLDNVNVDYSETGTTDSNGYFIFEDVYSGDYEYDVFKSGYIREIDTTTIASDTIIYITLDDKVIVTPNEPPIINLDNIYTEIVGNELVIDLRTITNDPDNSFNELSFNIQEITSSSITYSFDGRYLRFNSDQVDTAQFNVRVEDPENAFDEDSTNIRFIENEDPEVLEFRANPDNGFESLFTTFSVNVEDPENDALTCTLDFGDNTSISSDNCNSLDNTPHTYVNDGVYVASLTVDDGNNPPVIVYETINVFEKVDLGPVINYFNLNSSNGHIVPSDLTLDWSVTHPQNDIVTCTLEVNEVNQTVPCIGSEYIPNYNIEGLGVFTIYGIDSDGDTATKTITKLFNRSTTPAGTPVINMFELNSTNGNHIPSDLTIDWNITHTADYPMTCTLTVNDIDSIVPCIGSEYIPNYNIEGQGNFTIKAIDNQSIQVDATITRNFVRDTTPAGTPVINMFELNSTNGNHIPSDLTIDWNITHTADYPMTCTLTVNDIDSIVPCIGSEYIPNYNIEGQGNFTIKAIDNQSIQVSKTINEDFNRKIIVGTPVITNFNVDSSNNKFVPTNLTIDWNVIHTANYPMTCKLSINGVNETIGCNSNKIIIDYNLTGNAEFIIHAIDNQSIEVSEKIIRNFERDLGKPVITKFDIDSSNGYYVPTNLTIDWNVTHTTGLPTSCTLSINGVNESIGCNSDKSILNYNKTGNAEFIIYAIDNLSNEVSKTINQKFEEVPATLDTLQPRLIVDRILNKGEFDFEIETRNESLVRRLIDVKPTIVCRGTTNHLVYPPSGKLTKHAVSKSISDITRFQFVTHTSDFELKVPTNEQCKLVVELFDRYGSVIVLEEYVSFIYPEEESRVSSIRGQGTDIINYMHTALGVDIQRGYNTIDFKVDNREQDSKDLEITMMSRELNIGYSAQEDIDSGDTRRISIPVFINQNVEPGMYPIRISVYDGEDKQTRYSYIKIN